MIIAITGPSGSGKSTIAKMLASKHEFTHLCLDDYWIDNPNRKFRIETPEGVFRLFELASEYDGNKLAQMASYIDDARYSNDVVIEGFCAMAFPEIRKIVDWHFYIDVPWEISVSRRTARDGNSKSTTGWLTLGQHGNELLTGFQRDLVKTTVLDGREAPEIVTDRLSRILFEKMVAFGIT